MENLRELLMAMKTDIFKANKAQEQEAFLNTIFMDSDIFKKANLQIINANVKRKFTIPGRCYGNPKAIATYLLDVMGPEVLFTSVDVVSIAYEKGGSRNINIIGIK